MCRLDRGKYDNIKEGQDVKQMIKRFKLVEGMNKESSTQMEIEEAKNQMMHIC